MKPYTLITSEPDSMQVYLKKIWCSRALILTFARRDLKVKYSQTNLGLAWTILQPATAIIVYTLFFQFVLKIETGEVPYVLFVLSGLSCWTLFSYIFGQSSHVLLSNQDIIKKMAIPKIVLVFAKVLVGVVEFLVSFLLLLVAFIVLDNQAPWHIVFILFPILGIILLSVAVSLILLSFSIRRRDLLHVGPFLIYFGIWFTPVFYPVSIIPAQFGEYLYLNPLASLIDFFRWTIGVNPDFSNLFLIGFFVALGLFFASIYLFKNKEDFIVDYL